MAISKENMKTICYLAPTYNNPRNSEGDFLKLKDGRIIFAYSRYFSGNNWDDEAPCSIAAVFSDDNGETFGTEPVILATAAEFGEKNVMSVSLLEMGNGDAGLFYILKHANGTSEYILKRSNDNCKSFYATIKCAPEIHKGYYEICNCRVIKLASGRILIPSSIARQTVGDNGKYYYSNRTDAYFYYSDDDGFTWHECPVGIFMPMNMNTNTGLQEPGVVEIRDNVIYAFFRTDLHVQYESYSIDGGLRWTPAQPSKFTSPAAPMVIRSNPYSGKFYAIWNPIPSYNGRSNSRHSWDRTPLVIAESNDGLNFWNIVALDDDQEHGFCYPSVYFLDAETAMVAYCSGGEEEKGCLCRITIKKIIL